MTTAQIALVRAKLLAEQDYKCPLCDKSMRGAKGKKPALDHNHDTGYIRDVLCMNCNGLEGKVFNLARRCWKGQELLWITKLAEYWSRHKEPQHGGVLHPTYKTELEKRLAINSKARSKRAAINKG